MNKKILYQVAVGTPVFFILLLIGLMFANKVAHKDESEQYKQALPYEGRFIIDGRGWVWEVVPQEGRPVPIKRFRTEKPR